MADVRNIVALAIGGTVYEGWTAVRITRALDTLSGEFQLDLVDRERTGAARIALPAGAACDVRIDGETVMTGWVDRVSVSLDAESHRLSVAGRDKAADLIDCAAIAKPGSWTNTALETIAAELAKPFGIMVTAKASTAPNIRKFAIQQGETVHQAIERLARFRGLLAVSTVDGRVELIAPATDGVVARLVEGENLLSLQATHDVSARYSDYIVKGQMAGDDDVHGRAASALTATANDPAVKRHRPLLIIAEEQADIAALTKRARFEATTRAGRAQEAQVTVIGWRIGPDGALWDRNLIADLDAPSLFMAGKMLVTAATFVKDERGTVTDLSLSPPEAFSQMAIPEERAASRIGGGA